VDKSQNSDMDDILEKGVQKAIAHFQLNEPLMARMVLNSALTEASSV
jgi:hypothetical protein